MNPVSTKTAMYSFLDRTVAEYIQCLFSASKGLQKIKLNDLVKRLNDDIESIRSHFSEYMTARTMKKSLDLIQEISSFLNSDPSFLSLVVVNLRKSLGPSFNQSALKTLLNLRTDIPKEQQ